MEEEMFRPWIHEHPMSRIGAEGGDSLLYNWCFGCCRFFIGGEAAYGCRRNECGFRRAFHQECLEMPSEIRHRVHPSHTLSLQGNRYDKKGGNCAVCDDGNSYGMTYVCREGCNQVWIHVRCAGGLEEVDGAVKDTMKHPSHPQHLLRFSKKTTSCCDACGTDEKGNSYVCTVCDYSLHESCALLAESAHFPHHSHHSLSLAFHTPHEYIQYQFECSICKEALRLRRWVYHCQLCRYVVHIKCATDTSLAAPSDSHSSDNDEEHIIKGPIDDIYKEIVRPFVERGRGEISLFPSSTIDGKFNFCKHRHPLAFTAFLPSSSSHDDHNEEEEEDDDDDDDDENITVSEVVTCDGCTLPIHENKEDNNGYMSCDECKYFLHLACFNLPPKLPSHPLHPVKDHSLTLENAGKLTYRRYCNICESYTNGLYYACTQCNEFCIDIKCASLPSAIKHAAHPQHHHLNLLAVDSSRGWSSFSFCGVCYYPIEKEKGIYRCDGCRFSMCGGCVLLPARNKHRFDNHWLPLTYDAYVHHRGDFYCSSCESKMNPKERMYYCRDCDQSFHPECFPATSGDYRNIKYGKYAVTTTTTVHHHPLRFQIITKKLRCDLCHGHLYHKPGFQCDSCYFAMCSTHADDSELTPSDSD